MPGLHGGPAQAFADAADDGDMKPNFALILSLDGISLLQRSSPGWALVGEAAPDADDLDARMAELRQLAEALSPGDLTCKVVVPNDQIRFLSVSGIPADPVSRKRAVQTALEGATPYSLDELSCDSTISGGELQIAAVALETLDEADAFARGYGFHPVSFVARPEAGEYNGEPFFGAAEDIPGGETVERDLIPIRVSGRAKVPEVKAAEVPAPPPPAPTPAAEPAPKQKAEEKAQAEDVPAISFSSVRKRPPEPRKADVTTDTGEKPAQASETKPDKSDAPATDTGPTLTPPVHTPAKSAAPVATDSAVAKPPVPPKPAAKSEPAKPAKPRKSFGLREKIDQIRDPNRKFEGFGLGIMSRIRGVRDAARARVEAQRKARKEAAEARDLADKAALIAKPAVPHPTLGDKTPPPAKQSLKDLPLPKTAVPAATKAPSAKLPDLPKAPSVKPAETPAKADTKAPKQDAKAKKPKRGKAKDAAKVIEPTPKAPSPAALKKPDPFALPPGASTAPPKAGALSAKQRKSEAERMTVFGARNAGSTQGDRRYLGVVLTVLLVLFMAGVAAWASVFLDERMVSLLTPRDTVQEAALTPDEGGSEGFVPPGPGVDAPEDGVVLPSALPSQTDDTDTDTAEATPEDATEPAPEATTDSAALDLPANDAEAEARYAATGIWQRSPEAPDTAPETTTAPEPLPQIAGVGSRNPTISLAALTPDTPPETPLPAPGPGYRADMDERGLVIATPDGAMAPTGTMIYAGPPPIVPPLRPGEEPPEVEPEPAAAPPAEEQPEPDAAPEDVTEDAADPDATTVTAEDTAEDTTDADTPTDTAEATDTIEDEPAPTPGPFADIRPRLRPGSETETDTAEAELSAEERAAALALGQIEATDEAATDDSAADDNATEAAQDQPADTADTSQDSPEADATGEDAALDDAAIDEGTAIAEDATQDDVVLAAAASLAQDAVRRPQARPGSLIADEDRSSVAAGIAGIGTEDEAEADTTEEEAIDRPEPDFVALRPQTRPGNIEELAAIARATPIPPPSVEPAVPSRTSVARQATVRDAIDLSAINLIGVYGQPSDRRALVRLANGRYRKVEVGDRIDGGRVLAIGESTLRYQKDGRNVTLDMPSG